VLLKREFPGLDARDGGRQESKAEVAHVAAQIAASTLPAREAGLTVLNRLRVGR